MSLMRNFLFASVATLVLHAARADELDPAFGIAATPGRSSVGIDRPGGNNQDRVIGVFRRGGAYTVVGIAEPMPDDRLVLAIVQFDDAGVPGGRVIVETPLHFDRTLVADNFGARAAFDDSGRLYVSGFVRGTTSDVEQQRFAVMRLTSGFVLDATYGQGGVATVPFPGDAAGRRSQPLDIVMDGARATLAGVSAARVGLELRAVVAKLNPGGGPDVTFGDDGVAIVDFGRTAPPTALLRTDVLTRIAIDGDDRVVVTGVATLDASGDRSVVVARLTPQGRVDPSFCAAAANCGAEAGPGHRFIDNDSDDRNGDVPFALHAGDDGSIILGATRLDSSAGGQSFDCVLTKLRADGSLDTTFSADGQRTLALAGGFDCRPGEILVDARRRVVFAGHGVRATPTAPSAAFFVTRLLPTGGTDGSFAPGDNGPFGFAMKIDFPANNHDEAFFADALLDGDRIVLAGHRRFAGVAGSATLDDLDYAVARVRGDIAFANGFE